MNRINLFLVAAVASVGIFLSTQAFAQNASNQDEYYRYQSSQNQMEINPLTQPFAFRSNSDTLRSRGDQGVVVQRSEIPNPSYYEQTPSYYERTPSYYERTTPREDSSDYYQNREYEYSRPSATRPYYYENREYEYSRPSATRPSYYDSERYGTTHRQNEQYRERYDYTTPGYYENRPYTAYDRFGNIIENYGTVERPRPNALTNPFYYQGSGSTAGEAQAPGGRYNPKAALE